MVHSVASERQIPRFGGAAKGRPIEIDHARNRLGPEGNYSRGVVDFCLIGDETVLLDEIACEPGETITLAATVKDRSKDNPEKGTGVRGCAARPVLHADVRHAAQEQAIQMEVGERGGA